MGCIHLAVSVTVKEKQLAVIGSLLLVLFLINTIFVLVSRVPKTSSGILSMSLRQKLLIELLTRMFRNPIIDISVLVFLWGFFVDCKGGTWGGVT